MLEKNLSKVEKKPSREEITQISNTLEPIINESFLEMQKFLMDKLTVDEIRQLAPHHTAERTNRWVQAIAPMLFAQYMNPLKRQYSHENGIQMLEEKGMSHTDAERSMDEIAASVSATIMGEFRAMGKVLHGMHDIAEERGEDLKNEEPLSPSELEQLTALLNNIWNDFLFDLKFKLEDENTIARIRNAVQGSVSDITNQHILHILPYALANYFNALNLDYVRAGHIKKLHQRGMQEKDAQDIVEHLAARVNTEMVRLFKSAHF